MNRKPRKPSISRRDFIRNATAAGISIGAVGEFSNSQSSAAQGRVKWDRVADVVVVGAGAAGLPAAIAARDQGASVIVIDSNYDIGGHGILSGGNIPIGGGTSLQKKYGIDDSPDLVYLDHTNHKNPLGKYCDRDLIRVWADENVPTFNFLIENGVRFIDRPPIFINGGSVPRNFVTEVYSDDMKETINGRNGSGLVRPLEKSARSKGVEFLLRHKLVRIVRENPSAGRVLGIAADVDGKELRIAANRGVILATGGHSSNVEFRRMFDPRLTEEYQTAGEPWTKQNADGELLALTVGASLWATNNEGCENGRAVTKTRHIGCRWGYMSLKWNPASPVFDRARIRPHRRQLPEPDPGESNGRAVLERDGRFLRVHQRMPRDEWQSRPSAEGERRRTDLGDLRLTRCRTGALGAPPTERGPGRMVLWRRHDRRTRRENRQPAPTPAGACACARRGGCQVQFVCGCWERRGVRQADTAVQDRHAAVLAAWATPIIHDSQTGLRINTKCQVMDVRGHVIDGLYAAGETPGGFALHGLPRVTVFGRLAGQAAAAPSAGKASA